MTSEIRDQGSEISGQESQIGTRGSVRRGGLLLERFSNTCALSSYVQGGFFLRKKPLERMASVYSNWRTAVAAALLCVCGQAQQPTAHDLAARVDKHYNELRSLKAGFQESYQGLGINRTESGTLLLEKPGKMKWDYSSPAGKVFVLDGKFAWFYSAGDPQVQRVAARELDDLRSPLRFLLGHTELEKEFSGLQVSGVSAGMFTLTGQPKGEEKRVARISFNVNAEGVISGIEVEETDGALTRFTFTNQELNVALPAGTFKFTPPVGVPIVEAPPPV